jgi:glycosyltransferase involved in cell wall biosynthesis
VHIVGLKEHKTATAAEMPIANHLPWVVCQLGAREHYALPRALHHEQLLGELITDFWAGPSSVLRHLPGAAGLRLRGRYHRDLITAQITHFNTATLCSEISDLFINHKKSPWASIIRRNERFQQNVIRYRAISRALQPQSGPLIVFAYAYSARRIFQAAADAGATKILGQIDGGPMESTLVSLLTQRHFGKTELAKGPPDRYWAAWREECDLADQIIVNSAWSWELLVNAGVDRQKLRIVPVIYETCNSMAANMRRYPAHFTRSRPLRVLFLGTVTVRKGVLEIIEAARLLHHEPVEFCLVGHDLDNIQRGTTALPNVRWHEAVPHKDVSRFFSAADVFLFPTHSDGFGLTQLEAQDYGLPVIASRNCGAVIEHGQSGLILDTVSAAAIVSALEYLLLRPEELPLMSLKARKNVRRFSREYVLPTLLRRVL